MARKQIIVARPTLDNQAVAATTITGSNTPSDAVKASITHDGLVITANEAGADGNNLALRVTQAATEAPLTVTIDDAISVELPADDQNDPIVVDAETVAAAINQESEDAVAVGDDTPVTIKNKTSFAGGADAVYSGVQLINPRNPRGLAVSFTNATGSPIVVTVREGLDAPGANGVDATVSVAANSTAVLPRLDGGKFYDLHDGTVNMDFVGALTIQAWSLR